MNTVCNYPCLCCPENRIGYDCNSFGSHVPSKLQKEKSVKYDGLPKRQAPPLNAMPIGDPWLDPEFMSDLPALYAFLHDTTYSDKSRRLTGSLSFFTKDGVLNCAVNDNDRNLVAFVTAGSWAELITLIDAGIGDDSIGWKVRKTYGGDKKPTF